MIYGSVSLRSLWYLHSHRPNIFIFVLWTSRPSLAWFCFMYFVVLDSLCAKQFLVPQTAARSSRPPSRSSFRIRPSYHLADRTQSHVSYSSRSVSVWRPRSDVGSLRSRRDNREKKYSKVDGAIGWFRLMWGGGRRHRSANFHRGRP